MAQLNEDLRFTLKALLPSDELTKRRELLKARCDTAGVPAVVLDAIMIGATLTCVAIAARKPTSEAVLPS